ncbi:hypothetical protein Slala05_83980 [Streptomyces lavendulae subsp. lavendulae]|nr:hypothetical protein Slala05_83980 [Streptomyces lavendulae subsp. lavendulae]
MVPGGGHSANREREMSMSEQNQQQTPAFEHLVQTLHEVTQDPFAPGAEERLTTAANAAHAEMYGPKAGGAR